jgi:DNA-binding LacI/PurR family transcriptional regulator
MSGVRVGSIAERVPLVLANRLSRTVPSIAMDFEPGVDQAITHLHALGHRHCAFLSGPRSSWSNRRRQRLFEAGCAARGIRLEVLGPYEPQFSGGFRAADEALAAGVTAVFAYNDLVALGVTSRLRGRGAEVPGEISVIGFDDIPMASMTSPPLTTVAVPIAAVAQTAASMLLTLLAPPAGTPPKPAALELATSLVIRSTTAPTQTGVSALGGPTP